MQSRWLLLENWIQSMKSSTSERVCSEESFLRLVLSESKRSKRSGYLCRVALVYCTTAQKLLIPWRAELTNKAFSALSRSCRDTDYIGWYQQDQIIGVLLTTMRQDSILDGYKSLRARLVDCLSSAITFTEAHSLQMHILDPDELTTFMAPDCFLSSSISKD